MSNLKSTLSGSSYTQSISLNATGTTAPQPAEPPATVTLPIDDEPITVTDQFPQTITFTTPAPPTAKSGDSFSVAAAGGASGNPVIFTVGAGSVCTNSERMAQPSP